MGFLDNSGNIILDAVITDEGRKKLADGTWKIVKFAVGDSEINYGLYNKSHPSGSSYYDLSILQTPILEAMTNNISEMKSFLLSIPRTNLLYLPEMKINDIFGGSNGATSMHSIGAFVLATDKTTETNFANISGIIAGETLNGGNYIRVDQGLDTTEISPAFTLDADLVETQYIIEIDNRFAKIVSPNGPNRNRTIARASYIDDDQISSYYLSLGTDSEFIIENKEKVDVSNKQTIQGPRGTILQFKLQSSLDLNTSTFLFTQMGSTTTMNNKNVYFIDSSIKVTGGTTGNSVVIPVRFIKSY